MLVQMWPPSRLAVLASFRFEWCGRRLDWPGDGYLGPQPADSRQVEADGYPAIRLCADLALCARERASPQGGGHAKSARGGGGPNTRAERIHFASRFGLGCCCCISFGLARESFLCAASSLFCKLRARAPVCRAPLAGPTVSCCSAAS